MLSIKQADEKLKNNNNFISKIYLNFRISIIIILTMFLLDFFIDINGFKIVIILLLVQLVFPLCITMLSE